MSGKNGNREKSNSKVEESELLEDSEFVFRNKTTGDEIVIDLKHFANGKLDIGIEFEPCLGDQAETSVMGNCAMAVFDFLKGSSIVESAEINAGE